VQIQFDYDPSVASAPAAFVAALNVAAGYLDSLILNPITVTIEVGWGEAQGYPIGAGLLAEAAPATNSIPYSQFLAALQAAPGSAARVAAASLPATPPASDPAGTVDVATAEMAALGLAVPGGSGGLDGAIGFTTNGPWNFSPTQTPVPGQYDFIAAAEHEITHALGRDSDLPTYFGPADPDPQPLDLLRFAAPDMPATHGGIPAYFSLDGGTTDLAPFDIISDPSDWADSVPGDAFDAGAPPGAASSVTPLDTTELGALGFDIGGPAGNPATYAGHYAISAAAGATLYLAGTGQVTLSGAGNTANVVGGDDTISASVGASGNWLTNAGSLVFQAAPTDGQTLDLLSGYGATTLFGAGGNILFSQNPGAGAGTMMVAGAGGETLWGAGSPSNDQYWGSFSGGTDLMAAGSGNDILVGGTGSDTLIGGGGTDVFYVISAATLAQQAGQPPQPGQHTIFVPHAGDILALTGFDSLYGGAALSGAAARGVEAALRSGSTSVRLADGSTLSFVGSTAGLLVLSS